MIVLVEATPSPATVLSSPAMTSDDAATASSLATGSCSLGGHAAGTGHKVPPASIEKRQREVFYFDTIFTSPQGGHIHG